MKVVIPGRLRGKGRARMVTRDRTGRPLPFPRAIVDQDTANCEGIVRDAAKAAMGQLNPFQGPVAITVSIRYMPPPSWPEKKKRLKYVSGKPDLDNVLKLIKDAFNGIVWRDDSQVVKIEMERCYRRAEQEETMIGVTELQEERLL